MAIVQTLGVASCLGGPIRSCGYAAEMLHDEFLRQKTEQPGLQLQWHMVYPGNHRSKQKKLAKLNQSISRFTHYWTEQNHTFLVIGGDHSCALGTWGGVLNGLRSPDQLGLIWLDAHMDAHTFATSPSGNVHGMPLAALLGKGDKKLAKMYPGYHFILPKNLVLVGVRSYEQAEYDLLKQAGVEFIFARQIDRLARTLTDVIDRLSLTCRIIGISIDLDFIDPEDAPGVETPVLKGIKAEQLLEALTLINRHPKICGLELCEFNPEKDAQNRTLHLMKDIVEAVYGER
ncbi:MAG: arginase [Methylobacter sp.]|nr:arginase [Methylobacter sp.]